MTAVIAITILLLFTFYFLIRKKQLEHRFNRSVDMTVNYMFQEHPGQYSGDRNVRSGVFIFNAERSNHKLKNIVIRRVRPLNTALGVNLEQILVIPFEQKDTPNSEVSVRFKVIKRGAKIEDLKGGRVSIWGVMNFEESRSETFMATLSIKDLYQSVKI